MAQSSSFVRACTPNRTASAAVLTEGRYLVSSLSGYGLVPLGDKQSGTDKATSVIAIPFGIGSDNTTGVCRVWIGTYDEVTRDGSAPECQLAYYGSLAFTLSTAVGVSGGVGILSTERIADTLVWTLSTTATTPKGVGEVMEGAFGAPASRVYSNADNVPAMLVIPVLPPCDFIVFEPYTGGSATSVNMYVSKGS